MGRECVSFVVDGIAAVVAEAGIAVVGSAELEFAVEAEVVAAEIPHYPRVTQDHQSIDYLCVLWIYSPILSPLQRPASPLGL
jgi:hypothetical protein